MVNIRTSKTLHMEDLQMNDKMTSGEIAKKAGVSQKAVRLYDEKGLLKPTDYSEGNYRLYDQAALEILEKIVALKQIGFSLEEIRDNLADGGASDIEAALKIQLKQMEEKRYQIDKVISAINRTLDRKSEGLDWDDVAAIVQNVGLDQGADERHWDALKHTGDEMDWYVRIYNSLDIKENEKVLDLGCGFAKLWRNNWDRIPQGTKVYGYDIHGSWADDFEQFVSDNKSSLPQGVDISVEFSDIEQEEAWKQIDEDKEYSLVVAHYLQYQLKKPEAMILNASKVLAKDGVFSVNGDAVSTWNYFFKDSFDEMSVKSTFIDERIRNQKVKQDVFESMLGKYFSTVESVLLPNNWHYSDAKELVQRLRDMYPEQEKYIDANEDTIVKYFTKKIEKEGEIVVRIESLFWKCRL